MEQQSPNNAFKAAIEKLPAEVEMNISTDIYRYARTAVHAFEEIKPLRKKGVRFEKICKLFETEILLPENAKPHSLCQAFNREKARRNKAGGHTAQEAEKKSSGLICKNRKNRDEKDGFRGRKSQHAHWRGGGGKSQSGLNQ